MLASHVIFGAYGFWLPNDPRGSWSEYVFSDALYEFGPATHVRHVSVSGAACGTPRSGFAGETANRSRAHDPHDVNLRLAAKEALQYPPVVFTGIQARAVSRGFSRFTRETQIPIYACAIMPDHVHLVLGNHERSIKSLVGHLKSFATKQLNEEGINPMLAVSPAKPRTPWARGCWKVFLDNEEAVRRAIHYVEQNPVKDGMRPQKWSFVVPY